MSGELQEAGQFRTFKLQKKEKKNLLEELGGVTCSKEDPYFSYDMVFTHAIGGDIINIDEPPDTNGLRKILSYPITKVKKVKCIRRMVLILLR